MKFSTNLAVAILSLSAVSSALSLPNLDAFIVRRDDSQSSSQTSSSHTPQKTATGEKKTTSKTTDGKTSTKADVRTTAVTTTDKNGKTTVFTTTTTRTGSKTTSTGHTMYNPEDPAGGVVMITPAATAAMELYKIGDHVTWQWNYTNLQANPTAVDVLAYCSFATRTYTLTQNMTFATPATFTWDTEAFQENPDTQLITQEYTLIIYDAESSPSATAEAGYLGTYNGLVFGMYAKQSYTPLASGWTCATCSGALSDTDRRAMGFALTMSVITVLSFTWFVTGMRLTL